jgi:catechol-2,3-dioxygenase
MKWLLAFGACAGLIWAQEPARPKIVGVPHLAVYAKDLDKSKAFYRDFLGYEQPATGKTTYFKINDRQFLKLLPEKESNSDRLSHISPKPTM